MHLKAPADFVIVEPIYDGMAEGSKIIQLHDRDKKYVGNFHGLVISVGPDYPWDLKPGDRVVFRRHEGSPMVIDGKEYLSLKRQWVEAVYANDLSS